MAVVGRSIVCAGGMAFCHSPATVNPRIPGKGTLGDPDQREQRQKEAEPESCALQWRRPHEIVEVDALSQLLCCPRSRHSSLTTRHFFNIAAPSPRALRREKSAPAKPGCSAATSHAANDASPP